MAPIHHAWLFFPNHGGLISGIILAGYGFGALIFDNVSTAIVNPGGKYKKDEHGWYPKEVNHEFEYMLRVLIISWSVCVLIGLCLIFRGPLPRNKRPYTTPRSMQTPYSPTYAPNALSPQAYRSGDGSGKSDKLEAHVQSGLLSEDHSELRNEIGNETVDLPLPTKSPREASLCQMMCSKQFLTLYFMNAMSIMTGFFAVNNFKTYGQANGLDNDSYLAIVGSAAAVCNSSRFIWSWATDYLPYRIVYSVLLLLQIFANFTIKMVAKNEVLYAVWISLMLLCEGGHFTLVPNVLKKIYGQRATELYGYLFSYTGVCAIAMILLQDAFLGETASSYDIFFYINGSISVVALLMCFILFKE